MRPLDGIKVIEMAGLAPSPFCGMILADFGADVIVVDRLSKDSPQFPNFMTNNPLDRGKRSMRIHLKTREGVAIIEKMIESADVLLEPYRPGVMERLGLGPQKALRLKPALIYARLTGWGQSGPYASMAGHDINYIALSGSLSMFKRKGERPVPPFNILGDFAGGGMLCAMGIVLALVERSKSGEGQVVDTAMVDGVGYLSAYLYGLLGNRLMIPNAGINELEGGAPYYQVYETADGKFMAVGAIESRFYEILVRGLGLDPSSLPAQYDHKKWPEMTARFAEIFKTKTRDEWTVVFDGEDGCVAPVLDLHEVGHHPHIAKRDSLLDLNGLTQPAPAPLLSRTPGRAEKAAQPRGTETREILVELGYADGEIGTLFHKRIVE